MNIVLVCNIRLEKLYLKALNLVNIVHWCIIQCAYMFTFHFHVHLLEITENMPRGPRPGLQRGRYAKIDVATKERLITAYDDGQDYTAAARTLGIKQSTARSILSAHRNGEPVEDLRGGRREETIKLTEEVINHIVQVVEEKSDITLRAIRDQLRLEVPPVHLSVTSIARALDGRLITTKKLQDCPAQRNSVRVKADRRAYVEWYLADPTRTLVFVDESCFNLFTRRTRGRAERGRPAVRQLQFERGRNLNLILAVAAEAGVVYYELNRGTMTADRFQAFMDNLEVVLQAQGAENVCIVLDNASVHNNVTCGDHGIKKLPAYSPFLTPVENCFAVFKLQLREELRQDRVLQQLEAVPADISVAEHRLRVLRDVTASILNDEMTVTAAKVTNMKNHVLTYFHRCTNLQDILI